MCLFLIGKDIMSRVSKAVSDELYVKCKIELKKQGKSGAIARKLQAILSAKTNKIYIVCEVFGITKTTLFKWIKDFENNHISGLIIKQGRGRKPLLNASQEKIIEKLLTHNPTITGIEVKKAIYEQFTIDISMTSTYRLMHKLGFNYITARKKHYKQNKDATDSFKKNSS